MGLSTSQYDIVVTASAASIPVQGGQHGISGSWSNHMRNAINKTAAGSIVGGFTNATGYTAANLVTATTGSTGGGGTVTFTNVVKGAVGTASIANLATTTASLTTSTTATDTWYDDQGSLIFDGETLPYKNYPRKFAGTDHL